MGLYERLAAFSQRDAEPPTAKQVAALTREVMAYKARGINDEVRCGAVLCLLLLKDEFEARKAGTELFFLAWRFRAKPR
jgi:hypothetical protein